MNPIAALAVRVGFIGFLCFGLLILGVATFAVFRWLRWSRNDNKAVEPQWRGTLALFGFAVSTLSLFAAVGLWIHALFTGGFPFYHPVLLFVLRIGFWAAVLGLLSGLIGKGQLRFPAIVCSVVCFVIWLSEAMAQ
jgi:hypothetical protein